MNAQLSKAQSVEGVGNVMPLQIPPTCTDNQLMLRTWIEHGLLSYQNPVPCNTFC